MHERNEKIETIINNIFTNIIKIPFENKGVRAFFSVSENKIVMPAIARFNIIDDYYKVLFHELAHSTALNGVPRPLYGREFDKEGYAEEELIAELSSFLICQELGIANTQEIDQNQLVYIKNWSKILKDSPDVLKTSIKKATEIKDFLLGAL